MSLRIVEVMLVFCLVLQTTSRALSFVRGISMSRPHHGFRMGALSTGLGSSFIDNNAYYERESDKDVNANLGKEVLLYKDDDLLVYSKPHNVQTAPGYTVTDSLSSRIAQEYNLTALERDQLVVHRLDYATSGVIIYARNVDALSSLHTQFRTKKTFKRYAALVHGTFGGSLEGEISLPLGRDWDNKPLVKVDHSGQGKASLTLWSVVASDPTIGVSLLHLRPITGRTHQLRVHLASIGHPILGDFFYAPRPIYEQAGRLCLHAEELRCTHPRTGQSMRFFDPAPFGINDFNIP
jgi:tRNA pseudouridine32 synthase/23S rRNA pseudouridine746 synthase